MILSLTEMSATQTTKYRNMRKETNIIMLIVLNNLELEKSGMFKNNFQGLKASYDIGSS